MILPDGTIKEGYFSNNIFYGERSPSPDVNDSGSRKPLHKNYSQNVFKNAKERISKIHKSPSVFTSTIDTESEIKGFSSPTGTTTLRSNNQRNRKLVKSIDSFALGSPQIIQ
jgi:hypothetical protein